MSLYEGCCGAVLEDPLPGVSTGVCGCSSVEGAVLLCLWLSAKLSRISNKAC